MLKRRFKFNEKEARNPTDFGFGENTAICVTSEFKRCHVANVYATQIDRTANNELWRRTGQKSATDGTLQNQLSVYVDKKRPPIIQSTYSSNSSRMYRLTWHKLR